MDDHRYNALYYIFAFVLISASLIELYTAHENSNRIGDAVSLSGSSSCGNRRLDSGELCDSGIIRGYSKVIFNCNDAKRYTAKASCLYPDSLLKYARSICAAKGNSNDRIVNYEFTDPCAINQPVSCGQASIDFPNKMNFIRCYYNNCTFDYRSCELSDKTCGNRIKESGEDCDDGNKIAGDGCTNSCKLGCTNDSDCGVETCIDNSTIQKKCISNKCQLTRNCTFYSFCSDSDYGDDLYMNGTVLSISSFNGTNISKSYSDFCYSNPNFEVNKSAINFMVTNCSGSNCGIFEYSCKDYNISGILSYLNVTFLDGISHGSQGELRICDSDSNYTCINGACVNSSASSEWCGNGIVENDEECDDANSENNDACNTNCTNTNTCYDSDGGIVFRIKGVTTGTYEDSPNDMITITDECLSEYDGVNESYCYEGYLKHFEISCYHGCENGACLNSTGEEAYCGEQDGGANPFTRSLSSGPTLNNPNFTMWYYDSCQDGNLLTEYSCLPVGAPKHVDGYTIQKSYLEAYSIHCICANGVCLNLSECRPEQEIRIMNVSLDSNNPQRIVVDYVTSDDIMDNVSIILIYGEGFFGIKQKYCALINTSCTNTHTHSEVCTASTDCIYPEEHYNETRIRVMSNICNDVDDIYNINSI